MGNKDEIFDHVFDGFKAILEKMAADLAKAKYEKIELEAKLKEKQAIIESLTSEEIL